jgi:predicted phage terminase large subunit-like protein
MERIYAKSDTIKPDGNKVMRFTAQAAQFHAGAVHIREDAPWAGEFVAELLGFPGVRHDDQVDSVSQALAYMSWLDAHRSSVQPLHL